MAERRRMAYTPFPEAPTDEEGIAAVLITKDEAGTFKSYVKEYPGRVGPDPEIVAFVQQSTELRNL